MAAIVQIAKIRGPKLNNTWAFQHMVLSIIEDVFYELERKRNKQEEVSES